ncbi:MULTISPECIES: cytochrome oxidase putative small subunit CydP [Burkholderia]|uniref:Uncharacterized protein n=1 Tax=Burkholderia savannae TaxID=1637837 RepID=A0ABR5TIX8_9BURK|nr:MULTISPECIES: cytochrome oxidase putative small subunit CydP [Burkholderia]AOJ70938.1 hypothetical protein WS78_15710 [Burkholderia savannae]AOJ82714.1 hypothetical protein WS86_16345 [Burkholderia savannae]AOK48870.1 hypothetical protein WT60_15910 [Burkholderia sp. MSMB617WGS]KVG44051.1 hypothetical protein WS77_10380 [Burkholderia sp. MSMB0265]KVG83952.1 hypothetical protein WS81_07265 [Burkholderia sp. MSMB2040]
MALTLVNKKASPHDTPPAPRAGWRARVAAWARGPTLARDLSIVLLFKLILLVALKYAFFNHPQAEHMSLPPAVVAAKLLSATPYAPTQGDRHDK